MAFASADVIRRVKDFGTPESYLLTSGAVVYANTLCCVRDDDGKIDSLNDSSSMRDPADIAFVAYSDARLQADYDSPRSHDGGLDTESFDVLSGVDVYLAASGLSAGDEGKPVYAVDDQTVDLSHSTNTRPFVGTIVKVINATNALVHVPGVYDNLAT